MKKNKIYIAGAGGMLGEAFFNVFRKKYYVKCSDKKPTDKWQSILDFTDYNKYLDDVKNFEADYLVHLGAMTNLEQCESNPNETYLNNTKSVEFATKISNILKIKLVFISTAGIFDGKKDTYIDDDIPNPLCHYAKSKYESEKYIEKNSNEYLICRAGWMMGGGERKDKKFVNNIIKQIKKGNKELNIVSDKNGTPTYTYDFANNVFLMLEKNITGKFNLVCEGLTSRLDVAKEILKYFNLDNKIIINEVESSFFKNEFFVNRPLSERLINKKLNDLSLNIMRDWKLCLKEYLNEEYSNIKL